MLRKMQLKRRALVRLAEQAKTRQVYDAIQERIRILDVLIEKAKASETTDSACAEPQRCEASG